LRVRGIRAYQLRPGDTFTDRDPELAGYTVMRIERLYGAVQLQVMAQDSRSGYINLLDRDYAEIYC
jgi:hypothetical protein